MRATPNPPAEPSSPSPGDDAPRPCTPAERERIRREIDHLFRYSLSEGHINPLMHVIMDYRTGDSR